ncbi:hypothetical protein MMC07_009361 [Pseudocyphellaria aurata]|nr:hypothetical protein [Pseudocyphellaria aurata]
MYALIVAIAAVLLNFVVYVSAQQLDLIKNMCVRFDHQSIIKNNTLYIDGGIETFQDVVKNGTKVGNITVGYNEQLIAIDVSKPWDWKTNISEEVIVKGQNPKTGTDVPFLSRGALYHGMDGDENMYMWGGTTSYLNTSFPGWVSQSVSTYSLWSYSIISKQWDQHDVTRFVPRRPSSASSAEVPELGIAFYFNGEMDSGSAQDSGIQGKDDKVFLEGMIVIDTQNQTARNISTTTVVGDKPRTRGEMQYVPGIGKKGILVQIGGNQKPVNDTQDRKVGDLVPMDQIDIFDVASLDRSKPDGLWYKQKADGDIPAGRIDFCLFLATAPDNSSYNIYLYGGRGANETFFDDMYVLSLPSFTWIKLYEGTSPRFAHTCHQVGVRTLLTVGGIVNNNLTGQACDWEYRGVGVMDISTLTWGSVFNPNPGPYEVPRLVFNDIGGTGQGKATKLTPTADFSSTAFAELFPSYSSHQHKRSVTAIIIGSVIGSLVFFGVIGTALYLNRERIRRSFNGGPDPTPEIEGKTVMEIMDKETFWELDAEQDRRLRGIARAQKHAAELEVKRSVAELGSGEKEGGELDGSEKSTAALAVKKSVESFGRKKDEKDNLSSGISSPSGDVEIEVAGMGATEHHGSVRKDGEYF